MSDTAQGVDWWLAWDGKWYPPESRPVAPAPTARTTPNGDQTAAPAPMAEDQGGVQTKTKSKVRAPRRRGRPQATPAAAVTPLMQAAVARWGRESASPFLLGEDRVVVRLAGAAVAGYVRRGRWAVLATDVAAPPWARERVLDELLVHLKRDRLHPVFTCVAESDPYETRGMYAMPIAEDAVIPLADFSLKGKRMSNIRHSVSAAKRAGLTVEPWSQELAEGVAEVSKAWLSTKHCGEMGFTLGRFDPEEISSTDCRVAVNEEGKAVGFVTWHHHDGGRGRVLDIMRRGPDAPNPTVDLLIAESLLGFAEAGLREASLACVPLSRGKMAERLYPTASLRRYKDKFNPSWEPRWLVVPSRRHLPGGLAAVARSYVPGGLRQALRRSH
jgi:phosphatidylglycerol lysyltransferase